MYQYKTNKEYRQTLRDFFKMELPNIQHLNEDIDEESLDELLYDEKAVENGLNEIYAKTKLKKAFQTLYEAAAAKMISMDHETGLAVLLSYDYFTDFVQFLNYYYENENKESLETTKEYIAIYSKIK